MGLFLVALILLYTLLFFIFRRVLLRQHTAALKRKSRQILEELEHDRKVLESLLEKEAEEVTVRTARKEQARADAAWMKEVIGL